MAENDTVMVPAEVARTILQSIDRTGYDAAPLLKLISVEDRVLCGVSGAVPWADVVAIAEAFAAEHGQLALNQVARDMAQSMPSLRLVANLLLSPRAFFRVVLRLAGRAEPWRLKVEDGGAQLSVSLELSRKAPASPAVLEALVELLAASAGLLAVTELKLEVKAITSHGAKVAFAVPKGRGLQVRLTDSHVDAIISDLAARVAGSNGFSTPTVAQLEARFGLTRAESRVVRRLVAGYSLAHIAKELGVGAETVRTHAKRAMQKTDTHRQAELVALVLRDGEPVTPDEDDG